MWLKLDEEVQKIIESGWTRNRSKAEDYRIRLIKSGPISRTSENDEEEKKEEFLFRVYLSRVIDNTAAVRHFFCFFRAGESRDWIQDQGQKVSIHDDRTDMPLEMARRLGFRVKNAIQMGIAASNWPFALVKVQHGEGKGREARSHGTREFCWEIWTVGFPTVVDECRRIIVRSR